jgi:L-ornithine N5-oxygenase
VHDLVCVGFGPASLAIAIALQESPLTMHHAPIVSFLERQPAFAWHSGMQLPGARMQISFLKDLATPRNPQSHFTFLSYLFAKGRLNHFINLGTFSPARAEYEDYLRWCAGHFERKGCVSYGQEVLAVEPDARGVDGKVIQFRITSRDVQTLESTTRVARNVVIAVGGKPMMPPEFPVSHPKVIHSSKFSMHVNSALPNRSSPYNIAVIGSGQSAAEIFNELPGRYPNAKVTIIMKATAMRPSDDSPFVNEIFDPDRVDGVFAQEPAERAKAIARERATNYSVVRLDLLEHLYDKMYSQRRENPDPKSWKVKIKTSTRVISSEAQDGGVLLRLQRATSEGTSNGKENEEIFFDAVFVATGYVRNAHEDMLTSTRSLLRASHNLPTFPVARSYKVDFDDAKVAAGTGVWLQGCNEKTHGVSFSLDRGFRNRTNTF